MRHGSKISFIAGATAVAVVLVALYVADFLASTPPTSAAASAPGGARLTLQTVAAYGHAPHPDWVSYLVRDAGGRWRHTTVFKVPAHSLVQVTIYQYDTATGLRNPFWSQVRGTTGGAMAVNGKTMNALPPDDASHTFAIPDLGRQRAAQGRRRRREEPVQRRTLHARRGAHHDHLHLPHRQARHLPLAVLRAVRGGLRLRQRRADADDRLDGRPAEGGLRVTTGALAPAPVPATRRILAIWAVLTVIAVPLVVLLLGPHMPPGNLSVEARDQRHINTVLAALATPVLLGVWVFLAVRDQVLPPARRGDRGRPAAHGRHARRRWRGSRPRP